MSYVYATSTFADTSIEPHVIVREGGRWDAKDPVVKRNRWAFQSEAEIEQATAGPGEKRSVRRPAAGE